MYLDLAHSYRRRTHCRHLWGIPGCRATRLHCCRASDRTRQVPTRPARPLHLLALDLDDARSFRQRGRSRGSGDLPWCWGTHLVCPRWVPARLAHLELDLVSSVTPVAPLVR